MTPSLRSNIYTEDKYPGLENAYPPKSPARVPCAYSDLLLVPENEAESYEKFIYAIANSGITKNLLLAKTTANNHREFVEKRDIVGRTALMIAARYGQDTLISELKNGLPPKVIVQADKEGHNAAHYAAYSGSGPTMTALLANLSQEDKASLLRTRHQTGRTPVLSAAIHSNIEGLKVLLKNEADLDDRDYFGDNVLHLIFRRKDRSIIGKETLVKFRRLVEEEHPMAAGLLLKLLDGKNNKGQTPESVVRHFKLNEVTDALEGWRKELVAIRNLQPNDISVPSDSDLDTAKKDIELGEQTNATFLQAAEKGDDWLIAEMLHRGSVTSIEVKNRRNQTPLILAAANGHSETLRLLIRKGANLLAEDSIGMTALSWAAFRGELETARILLETDYCDKLLAKKCTFLQRSPLIYASLRGGRDLVQLLLDYGAEVYHINDKGEKCVDADVDGASPVLLAASRGNVDVLTALLYCDSADYNMLDKKDKFKKTALDWATDQKHHAVADYICFHKKKHISISISCFIGTMLILTATVFSMFYSPKYGHCFALPLATEAVLLYILGANMYIQALFGFELACHIVRQLDTCDCGDFLTPIITKYAEFKVPKISKAQVLWTPGWFTSIAFYGLFPFGFLLGRGIIDGCFNLEISFGNAMQMIVIIFGVVVPLALSLVPLILRPKNLRICFYLRKTLYKPPFSFVKRCLSEPRRQRPCLLEKSVTRWKELIQQGYAGIVRFFVFSFTTALTPLSNILFLTPSNEVAMEVINNTNYTILQG